MRFSFVFLALAGASAAFASTLAEQVGTIPAYLQLQQKHFSGSLASGEQQEFIDLGKKIHHQNPSSLQRLAGTTSEAKQLVDDLVNGLLTPLKDLESHLHSRSADAETDVANKAKQLGHVPTFIELNKEASKPDASPEAIEKLVKQGLTMLSKGYNKGSLKALLGSSPAGKELLSKISQAKDAGKKRNVKPAFDQVRRSHLVKRQEVAV